MEDQLAQIYCDLADDTKLVITRAATQQQSGGTDCGLFSIAFAYHAARGDNVSKLSFDPEQLRSHVFTCFEWKMLAPFPTNMAERVSRCREKQLNIELYCYRKMPEGFDKQMVQCDKCEEWFHFRCYKITSAPDTFVCRECK